jgi:hypothetical protein
MLGLVGAAVDFSRASALQVELQGAADAAALAGAQQLASSEGAEAAETVARRIFEGRIRDARTPPQVNVDASTETVTIAASADVDTAFVRILGITEIPVSAAAAAKVMPAAGPPVCFHSLAASGTAVNASGGVDINAAPCLTWINSSSPGSVNMSGGSTVTSLRNCVAGGTPAGFTPPAEQCAARADPYAGASPPIPATLPTCGAVNISGFGTVRRAPCIYTGGINISGMGSVEFEPGVHVIRGGSLNISLVNGSITANGVVFVLENGATVNLSGSGVTYRLTAPASGDFAGFVFYQRTGTTGSFNISGMNDFYFEGAFYLPSHTMNISGTNTGTTTSPFTAIIARTFNLSGTGAWTMDYDPPNMTVPVPRDLRTGTSTVALVR